MKNCNVGLPSKYQMGLLVHQSINTFSYSQYLIFQRKAKTLNRTNYEIMYCVKGGEGEEILPDDQLMPEE